MATVPVSIQDFGIGADTLQPFQSPVFVGIDDFGASPDWLVIGQWAPIRAFTDAGVGSGTLAIGIASRPEWSDIGIGGDVIDFVTHIQPTVELVIPDFGEGLDTVSLNGKFLTVLTDLGLGDDYLNIGQIALPVLPDPLPGQVPGNINFVLNPSVEVDLRGWAQDPGDAFGLVPTRTAGDAWVGDWKVEVTEEAGLGEVWLVIQGAPALDVPGDSWWIASISVRGVVAVFQPLLKLVYTDTTVHTGGLAPIATTLDWARWESAPLQGDPLKIVDRAELWVGIVREPSPVTFYLDGAQIETSPFGGATPYIDGDQGEGYAWWGPEHYSVSYRMPM